LALTGHKSNINCVDPHPLNPNLFVSWFYFVFFDFIYFFFFESSYDKTIKLWDLEKKEHIDNINYHEDNIWAVKYSMSGKSIISGTCIYFT